VRSQHASIPGRRTLILRRLIPPFRSSWQHDVGSGCVQAISRRRAERRTDSQRIPCVAYDSQFPDLSASCRNQTNASGARIPFRELILAGTVSGSQKTSLKRQVALYFATSVLNLKAQMPEKASDCAIFIKNFKMFPRNPNSRQEGDIPTRTVPSAVYPGLLEDCLSPPSSYPQS